MSFVPADYWPPGPPTGGAATDQTARDAAAAAQSTANAAVSTGAELDALLKGDPAASAALDYRSPISVKDGRCGAKGDGVKVTGGGAMSSSATQTRLTLDPAAPGYVALTSADAGKAVAVKGAIAGGVWGLVGTIVSVTSATVAVLSASCTATVTAADVYLGTDDTVAFAAAKNLLAGVGGTIDVPPSAGFYFLSHLVIDNTWSSIRVAGRGKPRLFSADRGSGMFSYDLVQEYSLPGAALSGTAPEGRRTVTLADAADARKPAAGAMVLIASWNADPGAAVQFPLGEWNVVESVSGATVTLKHPLRHTYRPSYAGSNPPQKIITLTTRPRDFSIENLTLEQWTTMPFEVHGMNIGMRNVDTEGCAAPIGRGRFFDLQYHATIRTDWFTTGPPAHGRIPYVGGFDTTSTDCRIRAVAESDASAVLHLHEGVAHMDCDIDVTSGELDAAGDAVNWGLISLGVGTHSIRVRGTLHNSPLGYGFFNSGGIYPSMPGGRGVELDLTVTGKATMVGRSSGSGASNASTPSWPIDLRQRGGVRSPALLTDAGLVYARNMMPLNPRMEDLTATSATATTDPNGDAVVDFADVATGQVVWQKDVPQEYVLRRYATVVSEWAPTTDGDGVAANSGVRIDTAIGQAAAGVGVSVWQTAISQFPNAWMSGGFVYASGTFALAGTTNRRLGILIQRLGSAGADHFTGVMRLRRIWLTLFDPWNG